MNWTNKAVNSSILFSAKLLKRQKKIVWKSIHQMGCHSNLQFMRRLHLHYSFSIILKKKSHAFDDIPQILWYSEPPPLPLLIRTLVLHSIVERLKPHTHYTITEIYGLFLNNLLERKEAGYRDATTYKN